MRLFVFPWSRLSRRENVAGMDRRIKDTHTSIFSNSTYLPGPCSRKANKATIHLKNLLLENGGYDYYGEMWGLMGK
jgi:hypothetical protein